MMLEFVGVVEIERQSLVHPDWREMPVRPPIFEPEDAGEEPRRRFLVARRNDGVIQLDGHGGPLADKVHGSPRMCRYQTVRISIEGEF